MAQSKRRIRDGDIFHPVLEHDKHKSVFGVNTSYVSELNLLKQCRRCNEQYLRFRPDFCGIMEMDKEYAKLVPRLPCAEHSHWSDAVVNDISRVIL